MTVTASYVLHSTGMPPLLAPVLPPPPLQCVLHPEECSGRSAEGDWCGQGCSAQCAVQPSPDRCLYTVDCRLYTLATVLRSPHGQPALLRSCCPASGIVTCHAAETISSFSGEASGA